MHTNDRIRAINLLTLQVTTLAGSKQGYKDGTGTDAQFFHSAGMCVHHRDRQIFIADSGNNCIRRVNINTGSITGIEYNSISDHDLLAEVITFVGKRQAGSQDGVGQSAGLNNPQGLCLDESRNILYIADTVGHNVITYLLTVIVF
jgi:sugar lactone lactonase YvrE